MFTKIAGALLAATLLTAPAFAEGASKNPAPVAAQSVKADVKADAGKSLAGKSFKVTHVRKHVRHFAKHGKTVKIVKATRTVKVKHIQVSKRHGHNGAQASTKTLIKTN